MLTTRKLWDWTKGLQAWWSGALAGKECAYAR